jgi:hypothetical protein
MCKSSFICLLMKPCRLRLSQCVSIAATVWTWIGLVPCFEPWPRFSVVLLCLSSRILLQRFQICNGCFFSSLNNLHCLIIFTWITSVVVTALLLKLRTHQHAECSWLTSTSFNSLVIYRTPIRKFLYVVKQMKIWVYRRVVIKPERGQNCGLWSSLKCGAVGRT